MIPRRGSARRLLAAAWPALAAWLLAAATLVAVAVTQGKSPFAARTWARWDSGLYADIARHGYTVFPCPDQPGDWCGDAAWFPLFPWLVRALHGVGLPLLPAAVALAWLLAAATLVVLWLFLLDWSVGPAALVAILYAAFAPGQIFDFAAYPLSLLALATVVHFAFLLRGRWLAAGLAGLAAALAYPLGLLLAVSSGVWLLVDGRPAIRERLRRRAALVSGLTAAGGATVLIVQRIDTGRWNAFFLVQAKYEHAWHSPLTALRTDLYAVRSATPLVRLASAPPAQSLFIALVGGCIAAAFLVRRTWPRRDELLIGFWALLTWALPQAETGISRYRSEAALLPLALLLPQLPRPLAIVFALAALALTLPMAKLFLHGQLI